LRCRRLRGLRLLDGQQCTRIILCKGFRFGLRLFGQPLEIQILLRSDGLRTGLFRLLPRVLRLLPVYLAHLIDLRLVLLLFALLLVMLKRSLFRHLTLVDLLRGGLRKSQRARDRNQQLTKPKHGFHTI